MNKKKYIMPTVQVYELEPASLLASSSRDDLRGPLYEEIEMSDEYCTNPE